MFLEMRRFYKSGKSGSEEGIASDPALSAGKVTQGLGAFATLLSQPQAQSEFRSLQVDLQDLCALSLHQPVSKLNCYFPHWNLSKSSWQWYLLLILASCLPVQVPKVRAIAVSQVAALLADTYDMAYECLLDPASGYDPSNVSSADVRHNPQEIRTILGIL